MSEVHETSALENRTYAIIQIITGIVMMLVNLHHVYLPAKITGWALALIGFYCIYRGVQNLRQPTSHEKQFQSHTIFSQNRRQRTGRE
jgi:hypothetical protein